MKTIKAGDLNIAYIDTLPEVGNVGGHPPVILLHGFPYDVHAYDEVVRQLAGDGYRCIVPYLRGYGATEFISTTIPRSGQQAALGADLLALMDALEIDSAILGGYDWGGRAACIVAALWPDRAEGLVSCGAGYNIQNIAKAGYPASAEAEFRYWYQYYFHTERGRMGLEVNRRELCQLIWKLWSPRWNFSPEMFEQSAISFDNPEFVDVVIHSYRHRFGGIPGDPELDEIEESLAAQPKISVPSIVLQGTDDGVDPPKVEDKDKPFFTGPYERRVIDGVGHNFPQEAPVAFAQAVRDVFGSNQ